MKYPQAAVVHANYASFKPGETLHHPCVESRMLLWNKSGKGRITINGTALEFLPDQLIFLPWKHSLTYEADSQEPFILGGIHIIPHYAGDTDFDFQVAFDTESPLANDPRRKDLKLPGLADWVLIALNEHTAFSHLLDYAVQLFLIGAPREWKSRELACMILSELEDVHQSIGAIYRDMPLELLKLKKHIVANINQPLHFKDLVAQSPLSRSTVERLFKKHCSHTPIQWINSLRIQKARELLQTSSIPVGDIGSRVGIEDAYYFSKLFKKHTGTSPSEFRKKSSWL